MSGQDRVSPVVSIAELSSDDVCESGFVMDDWEKVASFKYRNWEADMYVSWVHVYRQPISEQPGQWRTRVTIHGCGISGNCIPPTFAHGLVRAVINTSHGGMFDTGTIAVHSSGGDKSADFNEQVGGDFTTCELFRQTWCDW
jgi:hypothetical protein